MSGKCWRSPQKYTEAYLACHARLTGTRLIPRRLAIMVIRKELREIGDENSANYENRMMLDEI